MKISRFAQVCENSSSKSDATNDGREAVVQQDDVGGFAGDIVAPFAHRQADLRGLEGR